jgi:hypothetical protein
VGNTTYSGAVKKTKSGPLPGMKPRFLEFQPVVQSLYSLSYHSHHIFCTSRNILSPIALDVIGYPVMNYKIIWMRMASNPCAFYTCDHNTKTTIEIEIMPFSIIAPDNL